MSAETREECGYIFKGFGTDETFKCNMPPHEGDEHFHDYLIEAQKPPSQKENTVRHAKEGKWPIDRPCSACSAGDYKMEYHLHHWPPREGWTPEPGPTPQSTHPQGFSGPISGPGTVDPRLPQFDEIERLRAELAEARKALEVSDEWVVRLRHLGQFGRSLRNAMSEDAQLKTILARSRRSPQARRDEMSVNNHPEYIRGWDNAIKRALHECEQIRQATYADVALVFEVETILKQLGAEAPDDKG